MKQSTHYFSGEFQKKLKASHVSTVYLFGSQAKGKVGPLSDYDVGVLLDQRVLLDHFFDLKLRLIHEFCLFFKTERVDLVILNEAPIVLCMNVIRDGKILFCIDPALRVAFETTVLMRFADRLPYEKRYLNYLTRKWA